MFKKGKNCLKPCGLCNTVGSLRQKSLEQIQELGFISPSQINLDRIIPFAPIVKKSRHIVIRNVSDELPEVIRKQPSSVLRLLFVGRLDEGKGIKFLLEVLNQLSNSYKFEFFIFGTGPLEKILREHYEKYSWVTFKGFVTSGEVALAIGQADIFCMPSLWADSYGLVTAQALQMGIPVVGSKIGGTAELVQDGETGMLIEPGNEKAWSEAFKQIFNDTALLEKWRQNMPLYKEQFNEDTIGALYSNFSLLHQQKKAINA
jgi:glycosyltransferase involved in cell wall biosynthesis